jgi:hypothetical protein
MYLPPYSPDYNPMEPGFSKIKANVWREWQLYWAAAQADDDKAEVLAHCFTVLCIQSPQRCCRMVLALWIFLIQLFCDNSITS